MKSIFKNKIPLLISLILVVVMMFSSVCYASSDGTFSDDGFKDTGYSDGSLKSLDEIVKFVGGIDVNNSGLYQAAVDQWGTGNVDFYYVLSCSPCEAYTLYAWLYVACEKGTNIGLVSIKDNSVYDRYFLKSNKKFMTYRKWRRHDEYGDTDWVDDGVKKNMDANYNHVVTMGTFIKDSSITATNLPRFNDENALNNYLKTGNPLGAVNYNNPDSQDSSAFKWDSFKGVLSGGDNADNYALIIDRSYSSSNMITHPEDYYVNGSAVLKIVGIDGNGSMYTGGYTSDDLSVRLDKFVNGYAYNLSDYRVLSVYGNGGGDFWHALTSMSLSSFQTLARTIINMRGSGGDNNFNMEVKSCRIYFTFRLYCKGNGFSYGRYSNDVRCLSFDLLNYDGSSQGGEEVDPAEGAEDGSGSGNGSGSGDGSGQGINININNQNTQNNGSSSSDPKLDIDDDDFSMSNVWKNIKSLFGLIDDPSTPEPDDGVMQMVKAGMGFMPSEYWTMILGLLSSAGIVSMIRIFRGS